MEVGLTYLAGENPGLLVSSNAVPHTSKQMSEVVRCTLRKCLVWLGLDWLCHTSK